MIDDNIDVYPESGPDSEEKQMGALVHILGFCYYIVPGIGGVLGPLILWIMKKDESAYIDEHGREAVNFQISMLIYTIITAFLCLFLIGFLILPVLALVQIICTILAAIKASEGSYYRYPLTIRFL